MITAWLRSILRCPVCIQSDPCGGRLSHEGAALVCTQCGAQYALHADYVDMRPPVDLAGKETVYNDPDAALDDPVIREPVLSAGVRQRVLQLMLRPKPEDALLDIGCGNGKFAVWNAQQCAHIVGLDPAARFAAASRTCVDLVQGDARALPFAPRTFDGAYSVDVFEHLDLSGVRGHLSEVRRVIRRSGAYFCFSNTRERSWLNHFIDPGRKAAESFHCVGLVDRSRDHLRKGDHVKAVETADALNDEFRRAGLAITRLWYLNPVLATYVETIAFAVLEQILTKRNTVASPRTRQQDQPPAPSVRDGAATKRPVRVALRIATALLMADVALFRRVRTGPFFLLARPGGKQ
jgi:ubiquinone/menaquinone biosynthesis C-methylase UbiE